MTQNTFRLLFAASATAMLSACASMGVPGFGDAGGCRTVYVFTGGAVQPVNSCGAVPRETIMAQKAMISAQPLELEPVDPAAAPEPVVTPVSAAAEATAPRETPGAYPGANAMIENADMAAFMARVRSSFARTSNAGAWGYMAVDAIAADDPATAQTVIDALTGKAALRDYWGKALSLARELYCEIDQVLTGSDAVTILYTNHRQQTVAETFVFGDGSKVIRSVAAYA